MTSDLRQRLTDHNKGKSPHTSKHKPWNLIFYAAFADKQTAIDFEKYLKTGSGIAFARKRLIKNSNANSPTSTTGAETSNSGV